MEDSSPPSDGRSTSGTRRAKPLRKRCRVNGEKLCQVCGDQASAHHFGALACDTCKAFFRRNALKQEDRKCLFEGKCPVDKKTRRFCPSCRLEKCFAAGMRTDLILDDSERKERMQKVNKKRSQQRKIETETQNNKAGSPVDMVTTSGPDTLSRDQKYQPLGFEESVPAYESSSRVAEWGPGTMEFATANTAQSYSHVVSEAMFGSSFTDSAYAHSFCLDKFAAAADTTQHTAVLTKLEYVWPQTEQKETFKESSALFASFDRALTPFEQVPRNELPSDPFMYWRLSEDERGSLSKLSAAYQDTVLSILKGNPPRNYVKSEDATKEMYFKQCENDVRNSITFAKRIEDFRKLQTVEQVAVLKASIFQVLGIMGGALYVDEKGAWLTTEGYFTVEHARALWPEYPYLDISSRYCKIIKDIVKNDFTLYALLHCIVLFDPCDERIVDRQLINSIRDKYIILLRHYLESQYSYLHSEQYFMALQEKIIFNRNICNEGKPLIKKFYPTIPNQLLAEVLDL